MFLMALMNSQDLLVHNILIKQSLTWKSNYVQRKVKTSGVQGENELIDSLQEVIRVVAQTWFMFVCFISRVSK